MGHVRLRVIVRNAPRCVAARNAPLCIIGLALLIPGGIAFAQQTPAGATAPQTAASAQPEVPFVIRLEARPTTGGVTLTWKDSPDVVGTCLIYRSVSPIASLDTATLAARVQSGVQTWTDTSPGAGGSYYAIVMEDARGVRYPILVPYRNVTTTPVAAAPAAASAQPGPRAPPQPAGAAPTAGTAPPPAAVAGLVRSSAAAAPPEPTRITGISAALSSGGDAATVSFTSSGPAHELLLFRGTVPITSAADLLRSDAPTVLPAGTSQWTASVLPGTRYWFAVVDAEQYRLGGAPLVPGANVTATALTVPAREQVASAGPARRPVPLPPLEIDLGLAAGGAVATTEVATLPAPRSVSQATDKAIAALLKAAATTPLPPPAPTVLPSEPGQPSGAENRRLLDIVQGSFRPGDYAGARQQLMDFLSQPQQPPVAALARFYLGQCWFVAGNMQEALFQFLQASDYLYPQSQPWIAATLEALAASVAP